jgi:hypothetical protein
MWFTTIKPFILQMSFLEQQSLLPWVNLMLMKMYLPAHPFLIQVACDFSSLDWPMLVMLYVGKKK